MAHTHPVVDSDSRFVINSDTRAIATTSDKLELIQGDHQSERITFEIPQVVEGHDMSLCDRIEIHYINIDRKTKAQSKDIYIADDVTLDGEKVVFTWLISGNATKYYGRLNFIVLFECLDEEGNYTYKWNTEICKLLTVGEGISNTAAVSEDYSDILEKFREEVLGEATEGGVMFTEQELTEEQKFQARENIGVSRPNLYECDQTKSSYVENRLAYQKYSMPIGECPANTECVFYASLESNLFGDLFRETFTVKEKESSAVLESGISFSKINSQWAYSTDNFAIHTKVPTGYSQYDKFGRCGIKFVNKTDKTLILSSDARIQTLNPEFLPMASWDNKQGFVSGISKVKNKLLSYHENAFIGVRMDSDGYLYSEKPYTKCRTFDIPLSSILNISDYVSVIIAEAKGGLSDYFEDLDDSNSYPVIILYNSDSSKATFYFSDGQIYEGHFQYASSSQENVDSVVNVKKRTSYYSEKYEKIALYTNGNLPNNGTYSALGLIEGETYTVMYKTSSTTHYEDIVAAYDSDLEMIACRSSIYPFAIGNTETYANSSWISNAQASLINIYSTSIAPSIPMDAVEHLFDFFDDLYDRQKPVFAGMDLSLTDEEKNTARNNIDAASKSEVAPIELESITIMTKVDSTSTLAFVNSEDVNIFIFAAEGTEDVTLGIGSKKFTLKPGGFSDGLYTFLYNGSEAAFVNIRGTFRGITIRPSVLGITLTVGNYVRIKTELPKVPMAYIPNTLATKDYVNSQKFSGSYNDLTDTPTIPTVAPFSIDSTASDYSTTSTAYGDQVKTALLAGRDVWYIGAETDESGKTVTKYTKVSWFNIEKTGTEAKLIVGVGSRTDDNSGAVTFAISV